jgi:hypothetical protein
MSQDPFPKVDHTIPRSCSVLVGALSSAGWQKTPSPRPTSASRRCRSFVSRAVDVGDTTRLRAKHGDAKLTDLRQTLAKCPKAQASNIYDRCKVAYEGLADR